jgi:hypothetical protein
VNKAFLASLVRKVINALLVYLVFLVLLALKENLDSQDCLALKDDLVKMGYQVYPVLLALLHK